MNTSLPITAYRAEIMETLQHSNVIIITAETGAGKSTQVPQYLLEKGYRVIITEPRRVAARTVAERVAAECEEEIGGRIGFRTAHERRDSHETRALFCTDGLALVRELMGNSGGHDVLVIDEVHEWNLNIEVLLAWAKRELAAGANFKLVIMSATMEHERLSEYFGNAPFVSVPGRTFPVEEVEPGHEVIDDVSRLLKGGHNVLVFQPGKAEIARMIKDLEDSGVNAEILPLHGELDAGDQRKCFAHYRRPKCIVATPVAQTSITIDDIDAVVDSGMERRVEKFDGVEGLYLKPISLADRAQRKGRAGRTRAGIYIDHCTAYERKEFPVAEILRVRLDQTVLRLAEAGFDAERLDFFHQPDRNSIHQAKESIVALGCMDKDGIVTKIGRRVARMPISVALGRMIVEADELGVVQDVLSIAALIEHGGITMNDDSRWRALCRRERKSDVMAQLAVYNAARSMDKKAMLNFGIHRKSYFKVIETRKHLASALKGKVQRFTSTGDREAILRSVFCGMVDHLYHGEGRLYCNGDSVHRELSRNSVLYGGDEWLLALPFDLEIKLRRGGKKMLRLVQMATAVEPEWLVANIPAMETMVAERIECEHRKQELAQLRSECWEMAWDHRDDSRLSPALLQELDGYGNTHSITIRPSAEQQAWLEMARAAIARAEDSLRNPPGQSFSEAFSEVPSRSAGAQVTSLSRTTSVMSQPSSVRPADPAVEITFSHIEKRDFRCSECGRCERMTKTTFRSWEDGEVIELGCGAGHHGTATKAELEATE